MAAIISGKVFYDANRNGVYDNGESGIANVYVTLYSNTSQSCISTQTDSLGDYSFSVTQAGNYVVYEPVTNINGTCPPTNFTQPTGFTVSNGPRKRSLSVTQTQINNNTTIGNNNFSHDTIYNLVDCNNSFIQFAGVPTNWYDINLVTGRPVFRTTLNPNHYVNAIGYNPLDGYIYGYDQTVNSIVRVDNSGNITILQPNPTGLPLQGYTTGTFDANGFLYLFINDEARYYTVDLRPNSATFMKLVDPRNGYAEQTSNFGVPMNPTRDISDWVYNKEDGYLYGVTNTGVLARINPTTGISTALTTIGAVGGASYGAQAIDANGNIYAINNQTGVVYKYTVSGNTATATPFSTTVITSNNDGTICPGAVISVDFGDAPDIDSNTGPNNYNTLLENNGPRHQIVDGLYLGRLITGESDAHQNSDATGDDLLLGIQDDALAVPLPPITSFDTIYTLAVEVTNDIGENANLYGWIDFNQNGIFEESESATAVVGPSGLQTVYLTFQIPGGSFPIMSSTFVRLRLTTDNLTNSSPDIQDDRSVGPASNGEVEDYILEVALEADVAVTKSANPTPVLPGKEIIFTIDVVNHGPSAANDVEVIDFLLVELINAEYSLDGGITFNPWQGSIGLGTLKPGEIRTILIRAIVGNNVIDNIVNTVTVTSSTPDPNLDNNTDTIIVPVEFLADVSVVKTGSPNPVRNGEEVTYTIVVSNAGPSDAINVLVTDAIPELLLNPEYSLDSGSTFIPWSGSLNIGTLPAGTVRIILIRGIVSSNAIGIITNTVVVSSDTPDPDPGNNTDTDEITIENIADLALTKTADQDIVNIGELLTYTVRIVNNGPGDAMDVTLEDVIPSVLLNPEYSLDGVNFQPWVSPQNFGTLPNGGILNVYIRGIVAPGATGSVINTAIVSSTTPDPDLDNNTDTNIVGINDLADVAVTKVGNPNPVNTGTILTYTINVINNGPSTAENVSVTDSIPSEIVNPEYSLDGGVTFQPWSGTLNIGNLVNGQTVQILIRGTVNSIPSTTIENTVTVTSTTPDPDLSNNTDTEITGVGELADLAITKVGSPSPVIAGNQVTYTLNIINNGPSTAQNVIVTDDTANDILNPEYSLDSGVTFQPWTGTLNIGSLVNGASRQIIIRGTVDSSTLNRVLENTATVSSTTPDPDPENNIDTIEVPVIEEADLAITKTSSSDSVLPGELLTYTIDIVNNGPSDARNVSLIDAIPASIINPEFSIDGGVTFLPWESPYFIGNVARNETVRILIRGVIAPSTTGSIINTAVVTSSTPDPDPDNNTDTNETPVLETADISVSKNARTNPVRIGDTVIYQLTISNAGPSVAASIDVYDLLPPELSNPQFSLDNGNSWNTLTNPFNVGSLGVGEVLTVLVRGTLIDTTSESLDNSVFVLSPTPDPDLSNNEDSETIIINVVPDSADIAIIKTGSAAVAVGGRVTYTLTVTNFGPNTAVNVIVTDLLPRTVTNVRYSIDGGITFQPWNGSLNLGDLENGQTVQIILSGFVNENLFGTLANTATVTSDTPDPDPENNISTVVTPIVECRPCKKVCEKPKNNCCHR